MKKWIVVVTLVVFGLATVGAAVVNCAQPLGPAPNSGDGVSDGSGLDAPNGPSSESGSDSKNSRPGPAPNSGDGVSDGSGFDAPDEPNG